MAAPGTASSQEMMWNVTLWSAPRRRVPSFGSPVKAVGHDQGVMSAFRPVLLIDVDGVLNVYGVERCPDGYSEFNLFPGDHEPARLCVVHGEWLRELSDYFDLAWASAWGFDAHRLLSPILRIDEFPFVPMPTIPFPPAEKVPAIAEFVDQRPAAWLDDVVTPEARAWADRRREPTLLVEVDHRCGLERRHVDELIAWRSSLGH
jgi:hypothetical protein